MAVSCVALWQDGIGRLDGDEINILLDARLDNQRHGGGDVMSVFSLSPTLQTAGTRIINESMGYCH